MASRCSELGIEDLGGHLANTLADISVIETICECSTLGDTLGEAGSVGNEETSGS